MHVKKSIPKKTRSNATQRAITEKTDDNKLGTIRIKEIIEDVDKLTRDDQSKRKSISSA